MAYLPIFINLSGKKVLVIGGGKTAARRAKEFAEQGAEITVVAKQICPEIAKIKGAVLIERGAEISDIKPDFFAVIAAASCPKLNEAICQECRRQSILINRCDCFEKGNFVCGKTMRVGGIILSVFSGGVPEMSQYIANRLNKTLTPELAIMAAMLCELRPQIKKSKIKRAVVKEFIDSIITEKNLKRIASEGVVKLKAEVISCL